jgi:hypothetical protein
MITSRDSQRIERRGHLHLSATAGRAVALAARLVDLLAAHRPRGAEAVRPEADR